METIDKVTQNALDRIKRNLERQERESARPPRPTMDSPVGIDAMGSEEEWNAAFKRFRSKTVNIYGQVTNRQKMEIPEFNTSIVSVDW